MTENKEETGTDLAVFSPVNPLAVFQSAEKVDELIAGITRIVDEFQPDLTTNKGRKEIASLAYKVARTKTALDDAGKKLNEDHRKKINVVDEQRRTLRDKLDALSSRARKPLDDWEAAEEARQSAVNRVMSALDIAAFIDPNETAHDLGLRISEVEAMEFDADVFQEWLEIAVKKKSDTLELLRGIHANTVKAEENAAKLAELQAAEDARLAREAEEAAEAEAAAEAAAEEAREKQAAEEAEAKRLADIKAAEDKAAADAKTAADAAAAAKIAEAEAETERLRHVEENRLAAIKKEADEQAARDADKKHRGAVMKAAKEAIMEHGGISESDAKKIVLAIGAGEIPNISIKF